MPAKRRKRSRSPIQHFLATIPPLIALAAAPLRAGLCVSDCNGDAAVAVNELVTSVGIVLGESPASRCLTTDADGDRRVTVDELVKAVQTALGGGCAWDQVFIRDEQGRALLLRGANVSNAAKSDPQRLPFVNRDDVLRISRDFGFNLARYLVLWDGLEPQPGEYSETYLDLIAERMEWFREAGVYVVFDMHQDVYSRHFCCDGAPRWAIRDDGLPFEQQPFWFLNYFQPAVVRAFDNFWNYDGPHSDLQDHYAEAWRRIAARFKDHPAVLGYDLMNEPFPGSAFSLSEVQRNEEPNGTAANFDRTLFRAFYERMIARIREVDPDNWIFYEPRYGAPSIGMPSYIGKLDDPREGEDRIAGFPHLYSLQLEAGGGYDPATDPTIPEWARRRRAEAEANREPMLIGEFGLTDAATNGNQHIEDVLRMSEGVVSGWAIWSYDPDGGYGIVNPDRTEKERVGILVRTYAQRIAGQPLYFDYDPTSRSFRLAFRETGVAAPTEIYVPAARHYPHGFEVFASDPDGRWTQSWDAAREVLSITTDPEQPQHLIAIVARAPGETATRGAASR